jgi:hypothetical protein
MSTPATPLAGAIARIGAVAPIGLLDVISLDGYSYHWSTHPVASAAALGIPVLFNTGSVPKWNSFLRVPSWNDTYLAWLTKAGPFSLQRSMQSNTGAFVLQNVSGNPIQRDMNQIITAMAFEGAVFAFREWNLDAGAAEFEFHGHLSIDGVTEEEAEFSATQLFNPSDYQGLLTVGETCPWRYASAACADTTNNPCENTWLTCRQPARFGGIVQTLINIQPGSEANTSTRDVVRFRQV